MYVDNIGAYNGDVGGKSYMHVRCNQSTRRNTYSSTDDDIFACLRRNCRARRFFVQTRQALSYRVYRLYSGGGNVGCRDHGMADRVLII